MDTWLLVLTCVTTFVAIYLLFIDGRLRSWSRKKERSQTASANRRRGGAAVRRQLTTTQVTPSSRAEVSESPGRSSDDPPGLSDEDDDKEESELPNRKKKVGTKKALKLAEKERRKEEREAEERYRERLRQAEDEEIRKRKKEEAEKAAAEAAAEAEAERLRQEEEARQQAEYELLKASFLVVDEGTSVKPVDAAAEAEFERAFVDAIKQAKVITLERLCVEFDLKTEACVEKIKSLLARKQLSGVLDDRGKFIYIEDSEYEAIAKFIEFRGRVTMSELVEHGNNVIKSRSSGI
ncbi:DDRGK domain-containing protein 1 [Sparganum proliferum]